MPEQDIEHDAQEFTNEQLQAALDRVGAEARRAAFAAGRPVVIYRNRALIALYPDGSERVLKLLGPNANGGASQ
jgi:hypothetical protein